jgi:hypothetical protein
MSTRLKAVQGKGAAGLHSDGLSRVILNVLKRRGRPLTVSDLHESPDVQERDVSRQTVYMALRHLVARELAEQIPYTDASDPRVRVAYQIADAPAIERRLKWVPIDNAALTEVAEAKPDDAKVLTLDTKPTNPKDRAATNRLDISVFPDTAVIYGALAMTEGDAKYGAYNYRVAGVNASVYYSACRRHLMKWYNGEEVDPKTKVPHLANALACIAVLIDGQSVGKLNDDRPPQSPVATMLSEMEALVKHLHELYPDGPGRYTEQEHGAKQEAA